MEENMVKGFNEEVLVFTTEGYTPIKDIKIGDMVLTHKGRFKPVLSINKSVGKTVQIKSSTSYEVFAGEDQEVFISTMSHKYVKHGVSLKRTFSSPYFKPLANLEVTLDFVLSNYNRYPSIDVKENANFWKFIGRYTGDGWYQNNRRAGRINSYVYNVFICCAKNEKEELINLFENMKYPYGITEKPTTFQFRIMRKELLDKIKLIGKGAFNKRVHPWLWNESYKNKKCYINGYQDADGFFDAKRGYNNITTISKQLAYGIKYLISEVYPQAVPLITYCKRPSRYTIEGREVNQHNTLTIRWKNEIRKQDKNFQKDGHLYQQIRKLIPDNVQRILYSLDVKEDKSYTVDSIIVRS